MPHVILQGTTCRRLIRYKTTLGSSTGLALINERNKRADAQIPNSHNDKSQLSSNTTTSGLDDSRPIIPDFVLQNYTRETSRYILTQKNQQTITLTMSIGLIIKHQNHVNISEPK